MTDSFNNSENRGEQTPPLPSGAPVSAVPPAPTGAPVAPPAPTGAPAIGVPTAPSAPMGAPVAPPAPTGAPVAGASVAGAPVAPPAPTGSPAPQQPPTATSTKHHVHHSYIWLGGLTTALSVAAIVVFSVIMGVIGEGVNIYAELAPSGMLFLAVIGVIVGVLAIAGIIMGIQVLSYRNLWYEIGNEEFNLYSGIFIKHRLHIPYHRIQSVNQRATLLQRAFGVCTVTIDTAGGSTNKAVVVPFVQKSTAEYLRTELFMRKQQSLAEQVAQRSGVARPEMYPQPAAPVGAPVSSMPAPAPNAAYTPSGMPLQTNVLDAPANVVSDFSGVFSGNAVDMGRITYEYGMTNKELILTGLTNNTGFVILIIALFGGLITTAAQILEFTLGQRLIDQGINWVMDTAIENVVWIGVIGTVILLLIMWALSAIGSCISYGGFRARRRETRIEVERGLLQHQFQGVDIDRVQSVIIKQGFIRRVFGYCELTLGKIDAIVGDSAEREQNVAMNQGLVIHPFVKLDRVPEILSGLVPEFAAVPTQQIKLPKVSLRRAFIRRCILHGSGFWLAVIVAIGQLLMNIFVGAELRAEGIPVALSMSTVNLCFILLYAICLITLAFEIVGTFLWFRNSSFAYNKDFMQITNGGFSQARVSFPRKKIQFSTIRSNPFQRRSKVATIQAQTAAGIAGTTIKLVDVNENDAGSWLEWSAPGGRMHFPGGRTTEDGVIGQR